MFNRILLPMDRSAVAECMLPHVVAVARAFESQVTLMYVMDLPQQANWRRKVDPLKVLVLTSLVNDAQVTPALQAGASGYLLKDISADELVNAIRAAHHGEAPIAPQVAKSLVEGTRKPHDADAAKLAALTDRERQVLALLGRGLNNRDIAKKLVISEKTVKFHVSSILGKLQVSDRTQAALFAAKHQVAQSDRLVVG